MGRLTFILGGARSGKSAYAQTRAQAVPGRVAFIATALRGDEEMAARIRRHREERPAGWDTLEIPRGIAATLKTAPVRADLVVMDCLTMLVSNLLFEREPGEVDPEAAARRVRQELDELLEFIRQGEANWIVVSNEVGLGLVPAYPLGRIYRDLLGRANQDLAAAADEVLWMVAGIPVPIHGYRRDQELL